MSTKVLAVVTKTGEVIKNEMDEVIYQVIDEPYLGRRGTLAELAALVGALQDETEDKFLFALDETGEITGALGSVGVMTETGFIEQRNLEDVFQAMLRDQQPHKAFLRDLLKSDTLDELFDPVDDPEA
jgi:hypothetical protein